MERLKTLREDLELYNAGIPHYTRNFTRDSIISALLMKDTLLLKNQLVFAAIKQGKIQNPYSGEELGKIFHEFPAFEMNNHSTEYNACDTTALFLIGHLQYYKLTNDATLKEQYKENILNAITYIKSHLIDSIFYEDPKHSGSETFALKVTYWKDSEIPSRENGTPVYPVAYFLSQAINLCGIRCAAELLNLPELTELAGKMKDALGKFYDLKNNVFFIALDSKGSIEGINSDIVHALYYLEKGDLTELEINSMTQIVSELETSVGYRTLSPKLVGAVKDTYHAQTVWPFEQAMINSGARKFNLEKIEEVSRRMAAHLDTEPELFVVSDGNIVKGGCDPQLWTIAAKRYFSGL